MTTIHEIKGTISNVLLGKEVKTSQSLFERIFQALKLIFLSPIQACLGRKRKYETIRPQGDEQPTSSNPLKTAQIVDQTRKVSLVRKETKDRSSKLHEQFQEKRRLTEEKALGILTAKPVKDVPWKLQLKRRKIECSIILDSFNRDKMNTGYHFPEIMFMSIHNILDELSYDEICELRDFLLNPYRRDR